MPPITLENVENAYNDALTSIGKTDATNVESSLKTAAACSKAISIQLTFFHQTNNEDDWCHWFCDEKYRNLASLSLLLLSFPDLKPGIRVYRDLSLIISKCPSCSAFYHLEFEKMKGIIQETLNISDNNILAFERSVRLKDRERLIKVFRGLLDREKRAGTDDSSTFYGKLSEFLIPVVECLYCPWLFSSIDLQGVDGNEIIDDDATSTPFFDLFKQCFLQFHDVSNFDLVILKTKRSLCLSSIILFFNSQPEIHQLAREIIMRYISNKSVDNYKLCEMYTFLIPKALKVIDSCALQVLQYMGPTNPPPANETPFSTIINVNHPTVLFLLNFSSFIDILAFSKTKNLLEIELRDILENCENYMNLLKSCLHYSPIDDTTGKFRVALCSLSSLISWKPMDLDGIITKLQPISMKDIATGMLNQSLKNKDNAVVYNLSLAELYPSYDGKFQFSIIDCYNWLNGVFKIEKSSSGGTTLNSTLINESDTLSICTIMLRVLHAHISSLQNLSERDNISKHTLVRRFLMLAIRGLEFRKTADQNVPAISDVSMLMIKPIREIVDKSSNYVLESSRNKEMSELIEKITQRCIAFDIVSSSADKTPSSIPSSAPSSTPSSSLPFWEAINKQPRLFTKSFTINILKSLKFITFMYGSPLNKSTSPTIPQPLALAVESLRIISEMDQPIIEQILTDKEILKSVFLSSFSGYIELSDIAIDIICQASDETSSRSTAFRHLLRLNPVLVIQSFTEAVDIVCEADEFSPCHKLIKVSQDFVDALYSPHDGVVDASFKAKLSPDIDENELFKYWISTWNFLQFTFKNTRSWGEKYDMSLMKDFFREEAHYCHMLLDQFRFFEVDLPPVQEEPSNGERLALPFASTIQLMCDLLRLRDSELLDACFRNILSIIELMKSFNVPLPESLVDVFKKCSTGKITNKLSPDNISQLLAALSSMGVLSDSDIESIHYESELRKKRAAGQGVSPTPTPTASSTSSGTSTPTGAKLRQRSLLDLYQKSADGKLPPVVVSPHARSIQPSAPARTSKLDLLRETMKNNRSTAGGALLSAAAKAPIKEIHPARAPGFNSRRNAPATTPSTVSISSDVSEQSEEESDDDGLFTERKDDSAKVTKIRNINRPGFRINTANMNRKTITSDEQKKLEKKRMAQRLNIDLGELHKDILSWNYHSGNPFPPSKSNLKPVPSKFSSVEEYKQTFRPLLMMECWQGIQKVKEENITSQIPFKVQIGKRVVCDAFNDVYVSISVKEFNDVSIGEADLLVLTYFPQNKALKPRPANANCFARVQKVTVYNEYVDLILRTYQPGDISKYLGQNFVVSGLKASR